MSKGAWSQRPQVCNQKVKVQAQSFLVSLADQQKTKQRDRNLIVDSLLSGWQHSSAAHSCTCLFYYQLRSLSCATEMAGQFLIASCTFFFFVKVPEAPRELLAGKVNPGIAYSEVSCRTGTWEAQLPAGDASI